MSMIQIAKEGFLLFDMVHSKVGAFTAIGNDAEPIVTALGYEDDVWDETTVRFWNKDDLWEQHRERKAEEQRDRCRTHEMIRRTNAEEGY